MNKPNFDDLGHLVPYDLIETDWKSFINTFGWNDHRRSLIELLSLCIAELIKFSPETFTLWIDGSFVTQKEKPNDLDIVFVIPSIRYQQFENDLRLLRNRFDGLDMYFVRMIGQEERDYFLYVSDQAEWRFQFTMTKPDRITRRKYPKGCIQIIWNNGSATQLT